MFNAVNLCIMFSCRCVLFILFLTFLLDKVDLLENGMARTPPMGWMSWGYYTCAVKCEEDDSKCLNEKLILSVADSFYTEGYQEAGYEYIIIDDCWSEKERDQDGRLVADRKRFPRGMKFIADYCGICYARFKVPLTVAYVLGHSIPSNMVELKDSDMCVMFVNGCCQLGLIHARGLKFGMYTNIANITCMRYPGSRQYLGVDADTFAEWEIDYLKVDGCFVSETFLNVGYIKLGYHLNKTARPIVYSCSWPYYIQFIHNKKPNYNLIAKFCNLWRNYHDVQTSWESVMAIINYFQNRYYELAPYHGPGHWNDADMLIFGTGILTNSQSRVHLAMLVMLSTPILLSCDMNKISPYEKKLLQNMDLIAISQDPLGIMAKPYQLGEATLWVKPHLPRKGDLFPSYTFALVNLDVEESYAEFVPGLYGLNSTDGYTVLNVFKGEFTKNLTSTERVSVTVPGHDVVMFTFYPL